MHTTAPTFSVILPTHNRAGLVARAITSVLEQSTRDLELIVIDDGSTDHTPAVLDAIDDPRLRVIRLDRAGGAAAARNHGLDAARGEYVSFQDSDDVWLPEKLERQFSIMSAASAGIGLCVCSMEVIRGEQHHWVRYRDEELTPEQARARLAAGSGMGTPCWLVRKDVIRAAGGFNASLPRMQDYECALRIARHAGVRLMSEVLVTAHVGSDSLSASANGYARAIDLIVREHRDLFDHHRAGHSQMIFRAGKYLAMEGRRGEAIRWFFRAWKINPANVRALAGMVLTATGLFARVRPTRYSR
jgi:glycosyltransferase involved in cell wall biosynthesis